MRKIFFVLAALAACGGRSSLAAEAPAPVVQAEALAPVVQFESDGRSVELRCEQGMETLELRISDGTATHNESYWLNGEELDHAEATGPGAMKVNSERDKDINDGYWVACAQQRADILLRLCNGEESEWPLRPMNVDLEICTTNAHELAESAPIEFV